VEGNRFFEELSRRLGVGGGGGGVGGSRPKGGQGGGGGAASRCQRPPITDGLHIVGRGEGGWEGGGQHICRHGNDGAIGHGEGCGREKKPPLGEKGGGGGGGGVRGGGVGGVLLVQIIWKHF